MALSALTAELKKKKIGVEVKTNYKKYYGAYPHAIRILLRHDEKGNFGYNDRIIRQCGSLKDALSNTLAPWEYHVRREWYYFNIFCTDPVKTLNSCKHTFKEIESITIEQMPDMVIEESKIKPELPRAKTVVVKQLPHKKYRYKVFWPSTSNIMRGIGLHALEAITYQINSDPNCKPIKPRIVEQIHRMGYQWGGRYFYANDEDIFSIISLINPRFISSIEKFVTVEELNAKNVS
jgi:hypothetical protein